MPDEVPRESVRAAGRRGADVGLAAALGLAATLAVALTVKDVGVTWDEPTYFTAAGRMRDLLSRRARPASPTPSAAATRPDDAPPDFETDWHYETTFNRHPPLTGYLLNLSWLACHRWTGEPAAYRMGTAVLFGVLVALLYGSAARTWGRAAGVSAAAALVLMPRVLGHAHLATTDVPSALFWFACGLAFERVCRPAGRFGAAARVALFGVVLGLSLLLKFTNWLVVLPLAAWGVRFHDQVRWRRLWPAAIAAAAVALALNPRWWTGPANPIPHLYRFLSLSLGRGASLAIPTYFLGRTYKFSLPWYNAPVLTGATTPLVILVFFLAGVAAEWRRGFRSGLGVMGAATIGFFWVVRALPMSPGHDGVRLFLPAMPYVAALAGAGVAAVGRLCRSSRAGWLLTALLIASAGYQTARVHPYYLAYYGEAVGGPAGAQRLGFESTYWWDAATPAFIEALNRRLPHGARVYAIPGPLLMYYQQTGQLRSDIHFVLDPCEYETIEFAILLCRQGMFRYQDLRLAGRAPSWYPPPAYTEDRLWHWYETWDRQWLTWAPRHGVPLIIVVRHGPGEAVLTGLPNVRENGVGDHYHQGPRPHFLVRHGLGGAVWH